MTEEKRHKRPRLSTSSECLEGQISILSSSGHTHIKEVKCNYTWTVCNFGLISLAGNGEYLPSPTFPAGNNDENHKWCILLYPNGCNKESKNYLSLYLKRIPQDDKKVQAYVKCSILNKNREKTVILESSCVEIFQNNSYWGWRKAISTDIIRNKDLSLLPDDTLTIFCEVREIKGRLSIPNQLSAMQLRIPDCRLLDDLRQMFENQQFSDVTLSVGGKEFQTHKAILAARSPVFKAMFLHDMEESKQNRIEIIDIDSEAVEEMLRFIYTGKMSNAEKNSINLLVAADKYALETLKALCEDFLCRNNLRIDNAIELLLVADLHGAQQLKQQVTNFISTHSKDIMETPEWRSMVQTHPNLLKELYKAATQ